MKLIGEKKKGLVYIYSILIFLAILMTFIGIKQVKQLTGLVFIIAGIVLFITGIYIIIDITKYSNNIIVYKEIDNTLILNNRIIISISSIDDVSYVNARSKSIVWKWGMIVIKAKGNVFKCKYVKDCEKVAKTIFKLMYQKEL